ncbi:SDR family oxidoreductase [Bradyrhizobium sp. 24]|uniref:SDR family NAD(P)-dependent oxidoreductase n=1 Tax=unclassified Bradyrhizobium TaxID=2631580 RepID=UPI0021136639|nr:MULTISPECIES: SDR family NAD(P)-dependent oxidoreductase [unclassified Bradyrhizobium]MCK1298058.1 SDR family oxidoreductase [Bradyrhizobium sp. 37]MCK1381083.1 SDR family oxidoreductase [Bradyrhizobium sp. 24]MCK1774182.1 SDR family oxidoreductase [Bradyrhizobium sp. 134]
MNLHGQVALIVGGYGAMGATISETLASAGATSVIAGRDGDQASALAHQLSDKGHFTMGLELDVTNVAAINELSASVAQHCGSIDILVNCVGFNKEQNLLDVTEEVFDKVYARTLRAGMFLSQAVAEHQIAAQKGGSQIHLLSIGSSFGFRGRGFSAFCAAKGGLASLLKQHAIELGTYGITVNGVAPGRVRTPKNNRALADSRTFQRATADIPLGRLATPNDVASAVHFFASSLSRFITGQILYVDGGLTAGT